MTNKNKNFYVWTLEECIKSTYEYWGIDMMSMYRNIQMNFPIATVAINKMYFLTEPNFYSSQLLTFEKVQYVYEAIANLIPQHEDLLFNIRTTELSPKYKKLNICSWDQPVKIKRIDLLMAVLLFTEEFIFNPVSYRNVQLTDNTLFVDGSFVTFKIFKSYDETKVSITIKGVILLEYILFS